VGKQARNNRRLSARAKPEWREETGLDPRVRLGIFAGVALAVVAILAATAIALAASSSTAGAQPVAAGLQTFAEGDHTHVGGTVQYDRVPPAGGPHNPTPLNCGVYTEPVPNENAVHSLEHGSVWITYQPTLPADQVATLTRLVVSHYVGPERYLILSPYIGIPAPIVASAWGAQIYANDASDQRLTDFIKEFAGGGQGGEKGAACTGGVGNPAE
jgi:uncharacterized lipoprotein YbaY